MVFSVVKNLFGVKFEISLILAEISEKVVPPILNNLKNKVDK